MRNLSVRFLLLNIFISGVFFGQKTMTLQECIDLAKDNNTAVKMAKEAASSKEEINKLSQKNNLPKVDLIAGYNHLGEPLQVNLQQVKGSIVEGTASQSVNAANQVYHEITGNSLPQNVQDVIYQTSKDIISTVYPNYNPTVVKQDYFLAGLFLRQPIYLGGKLKAAQDLSKKETETSQISVENAQDLVTYNLILQYIQVAYYNSMIQKQEELVESLKKNKTYAGNLQKAEIIPLYQKNWSDVALVEGQTMLGNLKMEKENALLSLKQLMGVSLNDRIEIETTIPEDISFFPTSNETSEKNTDLRILNSKKEEANIALKVAKAGNYPNIFAIGNVQFLRKALPLITPHWLVGVELQWTLFNGFETKNKIKIAESLVKQSDYAIQQKSEAVELASRISENKIAAFANQSQSLDKARQESYTTTQMVTKRMENSLSSIKDVNDALQLQYELEKAYFTSLVGYQTAVATYNYLTGNPEKTLNIIK